ncbi:SAF domain-containing protein [Demequina mangrovi]|uniref:Chaperone for flagella basal body P-ring formation n=1 Tax=Demequina mangrovi TaxID=1043493 RepID=A0A1H6WWN2_9MICO|nr:SAF domain-containing protein [Demequina mangrovi]SEJ21248.1 Chaperone for flagella basal body P-ring formation [Demequina mangrovi]
MRDAGRPVVARLRAPGWRDPRLVVGVLLIAIAVTGVVAVLRAADDTVPVYAAAEPLAPGAVLDESSVAVAHVRVGEGYLEAVDDAPWGAVLTRTVGEGELIPASAVESPEAYDARRVAVLATVPVASDVTVGAAVDVWATPAEGGASARVAASLPVAEVERDDDAFGLSGTTVYLAVPQDEVGALLDALATAAAVAVVGAG